MTVHVARQTRFRALASAAGVGLLTFTAITGTILVMAPAAEAADSSTVTVTAAQQDPDLETAPFPNLSVTVSQTKDLIEQGIRLTYSGGVKSTVPNQQTAGANFLQLFQCWGDLKDADGALVLDKNGQAQPDRTTCQYGSTGAAGQSRDSTKSSLDYISPEDEEYTYPGSDLFDPIQVSIPFKAINGKVLQRIADGKIVSTVDLDNNEFFTKNTTNEVPWAGFGGSGSGTATFEVQTNSHAPGLGCGNPVTTNGAVTGQSCWLVIVPRGEADWGEAAITKSALLWETWEHRLAVKLEFKPLGVRCAIGAAEKSLAGSELMTAAVASWQPKLCGAAGGSIFNLIVANEADQALAANGTEAAALALTTRALSADEVSDQLVYAPVGISGLAVGFAVDHLASPIQTDVPASVSGLDRQPFTSMKLTPRLVAKLLTDSYKTSLPTGADLSNLKNNANYLWQDPEFLAINDEAWKYQDLSRPAHLADLLVPLGRSDAAWVVWQYVLADPEAASFLGGTPDPWGMVVNPYSSTTATLNPTGTAATYPKDSFPKADPTSYTPEGMGEINLVTWRPYATDLDTAGYWVLRGDNRTLNQASWDPVDPAPKYSLFPRDLAGQQRVIGLTDTASAAKYQVFTAALRNPAGTFVEPTSASMAAAAAVMSPVPEQPQVKALNYSSSMVKAAADAYPLTVPIYAATNPAGGDTALRAAYASFIRYASGAGQTPGTDDGELPAGYAPLPASWAAQAETAATTITAGPTPSPTPSPTPTPTASSASASIDVTRAAGSSTVEAAMSDSAADSAANGEAPSATGDPAGPVVGAATPEDPDIGALRAAVPVGAAGGLVAALGVPLVSRIRRGP